MKNKSTKSHATTTAALRLAALRRVRTELGLNQTAFAAAVGMSKDAVVSWECGRNRISDRSAWRLTARLGRNLVDGTAAPVNVAEMVASRVRAFERDLRQQLGL